MTEIFIKKSFKKRLIAYFSLCISAIIILFYFFIKFTDIKRLEFLSIIFLFLGILAALKLGDIIAKPVLLLYSRVTGEELEKCFPIGTEDELDELAKLFDENISQHKIAKDNLEKYSAELERIIYDRTKEVMDKAFEIEESNKKLKDTTGQLVQSAKLTALGELTAGVAHELNQPLNGIKIITQSLIRDIVKNRFEAKSFELDLKDIVQQVNKMAEIIDHMRIFIRRSDYNLKEPIEINIIIEGAFKFIGQQLKVHNIDVIKDLAFNLPKVDANSIQLEQVLLNLITNARDALEPSEKQDKKMQIRTYLFENKVVIEVEDNGCGIPEEIKNNLFQPFFTTKEPGKGTGLGLSVSNKIIVEHKGKIEAVSTLGEGTVFKISLPALECEPKSDN